MRVRIVPNPTVGAVHVDGEGYGRGAAEVLLAPPFWEHRVLVRFGDHTVAVSERRLRRALDRDTCAVRDIVVDGPQADHSAAGSPTAAWALAIGGAVAVVAGVGLFSWGTALADDVAERQADGELASSLEADRDTSIALRASGGIAGALGVIAAGLGAYFVVTWSADDGNGTARPTARAALGF